MTARLLATSPAAVNSAEATQSADDATTAVRFIDCTRLVPKPWANGGGVTRTLARGPQQHGAAAWRVSIATLDGAAKFSQFPGYDRTLLPIDDSMIDLRSQDGQLLARAGQPVHFSGDLHVWVNLPTRPVNVLNVMCKRGVTRARVSVAAHSLRVTPASTHLLVSLAGQWSVESTLLRGVTLPPLHAMWISGRPEELALRPSGPGAQLASIAIDAVTEASCR
ncbi:MULTISPECIES: HutD family protein [unclassified Paraburkholderia]|uniref:HutD/Ves family protein n=1 Tax=unclassified Paraburkholderia TaxID=2615204 RepID=UPI002AB2ABD3|nr:MULTISPECIES: HutD family protein [unclassified Paraburkholderia]